VTLFEALMLSLKVVELLGVVLIVAGLYLLVDRGARGQVTERRPRRPVPHHPACPARGDVDAESLCVCPALHRAVR
jgi:hypothetical protein